VQQKGKLVRLRRYSSGRSTSFTVTIPAEIVRRYREHFEGVELVRVYAEEHGGRLRIIVEPVRVE